MNEVMVKKPEIPTLERLGRLAYRMSQIANLTLDDQTWQADVCGQIESETKLVLSLLAEGQFDEADRLMVETWERFKQELIAKARAILQRFAPQPPSPSTAGDVAVPSKAPAPAPKAKASKGKAKAPTRGKVLHRETIIKPPTPLPTHREPVEQAGVNPLLLRPLVSNHLIKEGKILGTIEAYGVRWAVLEMGDGPKKTIQFSLRRVDPIASCDRPISYEAARLKAGHKKINLEGVIVENAEDGERYCLGGLLMNLTCKESQLDDAERGAQKQ